MGWDGSWEDCGLGSLLRWGCEFLPIFLISFLFWEGDGRKGRRCGGLGFGVFGEVMLTFLSRVGVFEGWYILNVDWNRAVSESQTRNDAG